MEELQSNEDESPGASAPDTEFLLSSESQHLPRQSSPASPAASIEDTHADADSELQEKDSPQEEEAVEKVLQGLNSWSFDIFQIHDDNLPKVVERIFRELDLFEHCPLDVKKVQAFTLAMLTRYQPNPYHNFRHACDVLHAVYLILRLVEARRKFTHLEKFALAMAALCHDVDHPGLNNAFLVATYDPLALRYNDRAVLESHHAATCFIIMRGQETANLLSGLSEEEQRHMRKLMLTLILATDMDQHGRILRELSDRLKDPRPFEQSPLYTPPGSLSPARETASMGELEPASTAVTHTSVKVYKNPLSPSPPIQSTNDVLLLLQMIIKCADISNVVKPFFLSKRWAALLLLEWFRQGEIEKQLGLPISKFMNREDPQTLMAMTCGCIDYIAKPMYELTANLLPKLNDELLPNLSFNRQLWSTFSTNGRRASENAKQILGAFAPPSVPKGDDLEPFACAPCKLEGKLVATFSGHYEYAALVPEALPLQERMPVETIEEEIEIQEENVSITSDPSSPQSTGSVEEVLVSELEAHQTDSDPQLEPIRSQSSGAVEKSGSVDESPMPVAELHHGLKKGTSHVQFSDMVQSTLIQIGEAHVEPEPSSLQSSGDVQRPSHAHFSDAAEESLAPLEEAYSKEESSVSVEEARLQPMASSLQPSGLVEEPSLLANQTQPEDQPTASTSPSAGVEEKPPVAAEEAQKLETDGQPEPKPETAPDTNSESESQSKPKSESELMQQSNGAPLSLLFGTPSLDDSVILPGKGGKNKAVTLVSALLPGANRLISDRQKQSIEQMAFRSPHFHPNTRGSITQPGSFMTSDGDVEKGRMIPIQGPRLGFWEALRTHPRVTRLNRALESKFWNMLLIVATFLALFADDAVKGFLPKKADVYEAHVLTACLALFLFEASVLSIFRERYFFSFFFWLDLLGSLTLVPLIIGITAQNLVIARTGRAAKTVTRLSKLLQASHVQAHIASYLPIIRILKYCGLYRDSVLISPAYEEGEERLSSKPSQLWTRLSELTTQKLILGILILMILAPYLNTNDKDLAPLVALNTLDDYLISSSQFNASITRLLATITRHGYDLEYLGVKDGCRSLQEGGSPLCSGLDITQEYLQVLPDPFQVSDGRKAVQNRFRTSELISVTSDSTRAQGYYSIKKKSKFKYGMNIASTVLTLVILAAWCFFLSRDSNRLLIQPIERMVEFVKELAEDPVSFAGKTIMQPTGEKGKVMETFFVEAALVKIASLTKVALGDAGMDILSVNLKGNEFNPMLPGKKIRACFGFCDIRNFTDATECLQEDVMMFVNRIADVVHNKVVLHAGFPNKNIGDAFLIVWKKTVSDNTNKSRATSFADRALRAFLDIIQSIETSQSLAEFAKHPAIQKRMPGYRIHMGFGLHVGWAIEGAIGSAHKVDPSYLSPHVNMASRLEAATKQYGVMILISETVIAHLTKSSLRDSCRKLDRVTVKGSHDPLVLYTFDIPLFQQELTGNPQEYRDLFEEAVDSYIDGDWGIALERLEECHQMWPTDKPAQVLLTFMASHNNRVPEDWQGYRELTEK